MALHDSVSELRRQARESTYSSDRKEALERLGDLYSEVDDQQRAAIGRTLARVARDATYEEERTLAQSQLDKLVGQSAPGVVPTAISVHCDVAQDGNRSDERERALDRLQTYAARVDSDTLREEIEETYHTVIDDATRQTERKMAQDGLADLAATESVDRLQDASADYLAVSLTEHLERACEDSAEACRKRLDEVHSFVKDTPVDDDAYEDVQSELEAQQQQLKAATIASDQLDPQRSKRIGQLAERVRRLYLRN